MLACMANLLQHMVGDGILVRHAHMELSAPSISAGFDACVAAGATEVIAFPYMLSPGKHSTRDIPRMVAEAAAAHPSVAYRVTEAFGMSAELAAVIARRAGVAVVARASESEVRDCWNPDDTIGDCGAACAATTPITIE